MNRREGDAKPSNPDNPKDRIAGTKLPSGLCPDTAIVHLTLAFLEGALKYGRYNWRIAGVSASVYNDALERHRKKWWNGQDRDPGTRVHHLANLMACAAIMLDAELYGMLNDDRPPCPDPDAMADLIDKQSELVVHLKKMFEEHHPRQFVKGDTRESVAAERAAMERAADELIRSITAVPAGTGRDERVDDAPMAPPPAPIAYCNDPRCYGSPGHHGPHTDYEGVAFPTNSIDVSGEESGEDQDV
jgi:hypothetical protein